MITLRPATSADIPSILLLERQSSTAAHWTSEDYQRLLGNGFVLLREEESELHGFLAAREVAGEWEIENVVVAAAFRRRGIADELMRAFLRHAELRGAKAIWLEVRQSNVAARSLYEKHGFRMAGRRPGYYRAPDEDAILYNRPAAIVE